MAAPNFEELFFSLSHQKSVDQSVYPLRVYDLVISQGFNPNQIKFVHVTGSKGKGSLAKTAFDLLVLQGYKTGLFLSPHVYDIRERFETSEGLISHEDLLRLFKEHHNLLQKKELCFFEICLFFALIYFLEQSCEYVVLEVGIGGRFDPTNFCIPELALIGHISLEHQNILGDTIEKIAYQKAGIIKPGVPVFSFDQDLEVEKVLREEGELTFFQEFCSISNEVYNNQGIVFDLRIGDVEIRSLDLKRLGEANLRNFCLVIASFYSLGIVRDEATIRKVAEKNIAYRMDLMSDSFLVDTAHTENSFENLMRCLEIQLRWHEVILYLGILKGKEFSRIFEVLKKYHYILQRVIFFDFALKNSLRESNGKEIYAKFQTELFATEYVESVAQLRYDPKNKTVLAGSFYSISLFMERWESQDFELNF